MRISEQLLNKWRCRYTAREGDAMLARADLDQRIENLFTDNGGNKRRSTVWEGVRVDHTTILEAGSKEHVYDSHDIIIPLAGAVHPPLDHTGGVLPHSRSLSSQASRLPP